MLKIFFVTFLFSTSAFASYVATHCSSADGSLQWRKGHNDNQLIKRTNGEEKSIDVNQMEIIFQNEVVMKEVTNDDCKVSQIFSYTKIWAATAIITPVNPLQQSETTFNKRIEEVVICRHHQNSLMYCP